MQQTNQYQLNLIESGDTFSADPLNENTAILESILAQQEQSIAGAARCFTGSYTGNGKYGSTNPNTLTFDFSPKFVIIMGDTHWGLFLRGFPRGLGHNNDAVPYDRLIQTVSWSGNTLSWYADASNSDSGPYSISAKTQLNLSGVKYSYLAIG